MGKENNPTTDETEGFQCLGQSNWSICSLLSQFCSPNFSTFLLSYWRANSYYPRGREAENRERESSKHWWDRGASVPWAFKLVHLQHIELIFFPWAEEPNSYYLPWRPRVVCQGATPLNGNIMRTSVSRRHSPIAINSRCEGSRRGWPKMGILQRWMRHRGVCTLEIQTGQFATSYAHFILFQKITYFHPSYCHIGSSNSLLPWIREDRIWGEGFHRKCLRHMGFCTLGILTRLITAPSANFVTEYYHLFNPSYWEGQFLNTPERAKDVERKQLRGKYVLFLIWKVSTTQFLLFFSKPLISDPNLT